MAREGKEAGTDKLNFTSEPFTIGSNEPILYIDCASSDLAGALLHVERWNVKGEWARYPHMSFGEQDAWLVRAKAGDKLRVVIESATVNINYEITSVVR